MQHEMLLLKIYYLQMILGNLLLQIVVHLKEFPIVQWGSSDFGKENNFPISFNVLFVFNFSTYSTSGDYSNNGNGVDSITLINNTKFKVNHGSNISNAKLFWIAIGI